jgi:hypothetical protein
LSPVRHLTIFTTFSGIASSRHSTYAGPATSYCPTRSSTGLQVEYQALADQADALLAEAKLDSAVVRTVDGKEVTVALAGIVRAYRPNQMGVFAKLILYGQKVGEFLTGEPRESNTEGGVFPAIFGTVAMTIIMSLMVTPFGVVAAFYLREYAAQGIVVRIVRIAINNLAGVPSIVFGVFGLGFFVYFVGGGIDQFFFADALPNPTFGTGGILWASLTLALLTVPVRHGVTRRAGSLGEKNDAETLFEEFLCVSHCAPEVTLAPAIDKHRIHTATHSTKNGPSCNFAFRHKRAIYPRGQQNHVNVTQMVGDQHERRLRRRVKDIDPQAQ